MENLRLKNTILTESAGLLEDVRNVVMRMRTYEEKIEWRRVAKRLYETFPLIIYTIDVVYPFQDRDLQAVKRRLLRSKINLEVCFGEILNDF